MRALPRLPSGAALVLGLLGPGLLLLGLSVLQWQRVAAAQEQRGARTLALAETGAAALVQTDRLVLDEVRDRLTGPAPLAAGLAGGEQPAGPALAAFLRARAQAAPQIGALFLADATGTVRLVAGAGGLVAPVGELPNLGSRMFFAAVRRGAALAVGGPCPALAGGRHGITMAEPLADPTGRFIGVVGVCDPLGRLRRAWQRWLGPEERLALLHADGRILLLARPGAASPGVINWGNETLRPVPGAPLRVGYAAAPGAVMDAWYPGVLRFGALALLAGLAPLAAVGAARHRRIAALAAAERAERRAAALGSGVASVRRLYERSPAPLFALDADGQIIAASDRWLAQFGYRRDEVLGRRFDEALPPTLRPAIAAAWAGLAAGAAHAEAAGPPQLRDGVRSVPVLHLQAERDGHGTLLRAFAVLVDTPPAAGTETSAEPPPEALATVGQLTSGVAHDFNNLLMVVMGSLERLAIQAENPDTVRRLAQMAMTAAERGARLTAQLLAYSRRQPLRPELVNPNRLVRDAAAEIEAVAGPRIDVQWLLSPVLDPARLDPGQFRATLLALVANAREAMAQGGQLSIETRNMLPEEILRDVGRSTDGGPGGPPARDRARGRGRKPLRPVVRLGVRDVGSPTGKGAILVAVSDTGCGMDAAVLARACEPFFTTKAPGRGSGLGLSMVQGFVVQSGGWLELDSEPGVGTTVRLFLPRLREAAAEQEDASGAAEPDAGIPPDAPGPDAPGPDARGPDARGPDAPGPDAPGPDARGPDGARSSAAGPRATGPDAARQQRSERSGRARGDG